MSVNFDKYGVENHVITPEIIIEDAEYMEVANEVEIEGQVDLAEEQHMEINMGQNFEAAADPLGSLNYGLKFQQHLSYLKQSLFPGTVSSKVWEKLKKLTISGKRDQIAFSVDNSVTAKDIVVAWEEAVRVEFDGNPNFRESTISKFYQLMQELLRAKLTCLRSPIAEININHPDIAKFIIQVQEVIAFSLLMQMEMKNQYDSLVEQLSKPEHLREHAYAKNVGAATMP